VKCRVFVDFDGTIAPIDTTDLLLERFADPAWRRIEEDWKAGRIGSRECLVRQVDLVRADPRELDAFIADIEIDPYFADFVTTCRRFGHQVAVVSDGLDRTVEAVLGRLDVHVPYYANHLAWQGGGRWRLAFPHARSDCRSLSGNCKCQFLDSSILLDVVVGDGRSDFCMATRADLVLAKGALLDHCVQSALPHRAFAHFGEATEHLTEWLGGRLQVQIGETRRAQE
jgi:2,3-diketo-5-methylthio-1-phosphopentane phosphatase